MPDRGPRAAGAVGRLGRRAVRAGLDRSAEASTRPPAEGTQGRRGRLIVVSRRSGGPTTHPCTRRCCKPGERREPKRSCHAELRRAHPRPRRAATAGGPRGRTPFANNRGPSLQASGRRDLAMDSAPAHRRPVTPMVAKLPEELAATEGPYPSGAAPFRLDRRREAGHPSTHLGLERTARVELAEHSDAAEPHAVN